MTASTKSRVRPGFHTLTVAAVDRLCEDAAAVTFEVPEDLAGEYAFLPGQSLTLRRIVDDREQRRNYSICAPAGARPRIGVREVPDGLFSTWLVHHVRPGDEVEVSTPSGTFTPDLTEPCHHVFFAAGSGITPVLSVAASVLENPDATATIVYGNRRAGTVMFVDELADLKDSAPARVELVHVLSREAGEAELFSGRLDAERLAALVGNLMDAREVGNWWLCGPFGMVTAARELLRQLDIPESRVHQELFYVEDLPPEPVRHREPGVEGAASEVTVVLDGRSTTMVLARDTSILDGAQRSRADLPFACKGGVCGTCRARVTKGEITMRRNFALEKSEVDSGFVLTCQSLPVSETLTVDYDS
ncbi:MAG: 1,2-phenylacetyl-CoA epoxidase subunit PaaE [Sciscionella sp.]